MQLIIDVPKNQIFAAIKNLNFNDKIFLIKELEKETIENRLKNI